MKKLYEKAFELHTRKFVAYGNASDSKLYNEADFQTQVDAKEAKRAFEIGAILVVDGDGNLFVPVAFADNAVVTVANGETAVEATAWAVKVED